MQSVKTNKRKYEWKCIVNGCDESLKDADAPKFQLFPFPRVEPTREIWITNVNLGPKFNPTKYMCVCGKHFADGHPTTANPFPELLLGWDCTKRPRLQLVRDDITRPTARMMANDIIIAKSQTIQARRLLGLPDELTNEEISAKTVCTTSVEPKAASSYSDYCSVAGCPNSAYVLKKTGGHCRCKLFPIPKDANLAKQWSDFAQLSVAYSSKRGQICALHFVDEEPTDGNPLPTVYPDFEFSKDSSSIKMKSNKLGVRPGEKKFESVDPMSFLVDDRTCKNMIGISSDVFHNLLNDLKQNCKFLTGVTKRKLGTNETFRLSIDSCLAVTLIKVKTLMDDSNLAIMFRVNLDTLEEVLKKWIPSLSVWLNKLINWPQVEEIVDPEKAVIMKTFGKHKVVGILDCLKISDGSNSLKFVVVYNLSGAIIFRSRLYDGEISDDDCVSENFENFIVPNLKSNEILLTSRRFFDDGGEFDKLNTAPNVNMKKAIENFYEIRLKKFSLANCILSDYLSFYDDMLTICCGLICLSPPVEFGQEESD